MCHLYGEGTPGSIYDHCTQTTASEGNVPRHLNNYYYYDVGPLCTLPLYLLCFGLTLIGGEGFSYMSTAIQ